MLASLPRMNLVSWWARSLGLAVLGGACLLGCDDSEVLSTPGGAGGAGGTGVSGSSGQGGSGGSGQAGSSGITEQIDLAAPASPEVGWQVKIPEFSVASGEEIQNCYFVEVPYDEPVYAGKITLAQNLGSHHLNVFRVKTIKGLGGKPGDAVTGAGSECWKSSNWSDWPLVANMQLAGVNEWEMPKGVAHRFEPHELLMVQTHFVNATTQKAPLGGKVFINFERTPAAEVTDEVGTAFATNQGIEVCPGDKDKSFETHCRFAKDKPVTIIAANGHFHSRGQKFSMSVWDSKDGASGTSFYESKVWDEPPFERGLNVLVPPGGGVDYKCEYTAPPDSCGDPANQCCFTFGPKVETNEHCNAFVYYYPRRTDTDVNCF